MLQQSFEAGFSCAEEEDLPANTCWSALGAGGVRRGVICSLWCQAFGKCNSQIWMAPNTCGNGLTPVLFMHSCLWAQDCHACTPRLQDWVDFLRQSNMSVIGESRGGAQLFSGILDLIRRPFLQRHNLMAANRISLTHGRSLWCGLLEWASTVC